MSLVYAFFVLFIAGLIVSILFGMTTFRFTSPSDARRPNELDDIHARRLQRQIGRLMQRRVDGAKLVDGRWVICMGNHWCDCSEALKISARLKGKLQCAA